MNKTLKKATSKLLVAVLSLSILASPGLNAFAAEGSTTAPAKNVWVAGDFHTHTNLSDGSYKAADVALKAFGSFGLDWYSAADHGGATKGTRNDNGDLRTTVMPRWESILTEGTEKVLENRKTNETKFQFNGFEWNVPGHEHASVGMIEDDKNAGKALAAFDYMFDSDKEAKNTVFDKYLGYTQANGSHDNAVLAASYLQSGFKNTSYFLPNHPSRKLQYDIAAMRDFNSSAPNVMFGFEGVPGHQKSPFRGGYAYISYFDKTAGKVFSYHMNDIDPVTKIAYANATAVVNKLVADAKTANAAVVAPAAAVRDSESAIRAAITVDTVKAQRTWGGADYMAAQVGGLWDSMLREGRNFWIFANSDFHTDLGSEPDFWPGEYSKNHTFAKTMSYQGILDGMRSGKTFAVTGDLIDALNFSIKEGKKTAEMGGTLNPTKGKASTMTIKFKVPGMNYNTDITNNKPVVDHIDLIAGTMTEKADPYVEDPAFDLTKPVATKNPVYSSATCPEGTVSVVKTFTSADWGKADANGYYTITYKVAATSKATYYRLRGTNLAKGVEGQTDASGNPLCDQAFTSLEDPKTAIGGNDGKTAFQDIWFYSNPIVVSANK